MAVIKKSENVMEMNNTISSAAGFLVSSLFIVGGLYYGISAILPGGNLDFLILPVLLIPWGLAFLFGVRRVVIILDKSSGKVIYDEQSIRGIKHLERPIAEIASINLKIEKTTNRGGRKFEFSLILKDGTALSYSTAGLVFPPKELAAEDFLGIKLNDVSE